MEGEDGCRMPEFTRWDRTMLQHEREAISGYLARAGAYLEDKSGLMHDLSDLDYCLAQLPPEENPSPRTKIDGRYLN
jgi:hypothetical protein